MSIFRHIPEEKTTTAVTTAVTKKKSEIPTPPQNCYVTCVARLIRKLKRKGRLLLAKKACRQGTRSLQCRYDPMSYSLNFDGGACGGLVDDEDYYFRFYAFSSRYVTTNGIKKRPPFPRETLSIASHEFV